MLTADEQKEIEALVTRYAFKRGASVEALKAVQRRRGWISDQSLADVAQFLDMTTAELDGLATFYNLIYREPVGRHVIQVCASVACWIAGLDSLLALLRQRLGVALGQTTSDGRFTVLPMPCLGACDEAPAMLIDGHLHGRVGADNLDEILAGYD